MFLYVVVWQEQQQKEEAAEVKKRPRKKTKPPALTRPPRKGKKKKGKNVRPQKPMPPDKPTGDISKCGNILCLKKKKGVGGGL